MGRNADAYGDEPFKLILGTTAFPVDDTKATIHVRRDDDQNVVTRHGSITVRPPAGLLWDYREDPKLLHAEEQILGGVCTSGSQNLDGSISITVEGASWILRHTTINGLETFGLSVVERIYWIGRMCKPEGLIVIDGFEPDSVWRPFLYAIPLRGFSTGSTGAGIAINDSGIVSGDWDDLFTPLLQNSQSAKEREYWHPNIPKIYGMVMAHDLMEAEVMALERANCTVDLINLAIRTGNSHFVTRWESSPLDWNAEQALASISLYPCILMREFSESKGWIRDLPGMETYAQTDLAGCRDKISFFTEKFQKTHYIGGILHQRKGPEFSKREEKLLRGIQRALRWLTISTQESDLIDKFIAVWVALEAILDAPDYPGVFSGNRTSVKDALVDAIRAIEMPEPGHSLVDLTKEMFESRLLQNNWPSRTKLRMFVAAFGITLRPDDLQLVRELQSVRSSSLHTGSRDQALTAINVLRLRGLVERLAMAASVGAYKDIEAEHQEIGIGQIGPEGGAVPRFVGGKEVPYEMCWYKNSEGQTVKEISALGHIFDDSNSTSIRFTVGGDT